MRQGQGDDDSDQALTMRCDAGDQAIHQFPLRFQRIKMKRVHMRSLVASMLLFVTFVLQTSNGQEFCDACFRGGTVADDDDECSDMSKTAQTLLSDTPQCSNSQLELFQAGCCKEPPTGYCTLCPNGSPFDGGRFVPNFDPEEEGLNCADIVAENDFLDYLFEAGSCEDTQLRRSASWCGCPDVQRKCSLCPNYQRPPNPNLVDPVYYGWSCDTFDFVSSFFADDECGDLVDSILEFDAPSFCGCPGAPIPLVCTLCPEGQILAHPDQVLGHDDQFTCKELALSTRYIPAEEPCTRVLSTHSQNGYIDACCAPIDKVPKELGGTASGSEIRRLMNISLLTLTVSLFLCRGWL